MIRPNLSHVSLSRKFSNRFSLRFVKVTRRYAAFVLLAAMLTLLIPTPVLAAALRKGVTRSTDLAKRAEEVFAKSVGLFKSQGRGQSRGMPQAPGHPPGVNPQASPSKFDREARAASIHINTSEAVVLQSRQPMLFAAIPVDSGGAAIHGLGAEWESSDLQVVFITKDGRALAGNPGTATLTAKAGRLRQNVTVTVIEASKNFGEKNQENSSSQPPQVSKNSSPGFTAVSGKSRPKHQHVFAISRSANAGLVGTHAPAPLLPQHDPNVDPLPDNETNSLYEPANNVGKPPGKTKPGAASLAVATLGTETGNKNFTFGLPIVSLPGRGIDVSLDLTYNSLLYNKFTDPGDGSIHLTYDVDSGWPAPGFRIGYGQIENQGGYGFTLTDADGTRHALTITSASNYDTTDGSFIHFTGGAGGGTLYYTDGSRVTYGAAGGGYRSYPTQITDRNGNKILISYVAGVGPKLSSIQDTLERFVQFGYASNGDLSTITAPGLTNQSDREVIRFFYDDITFNASSLFSSTITPPSMPTSARVIKYAFLSNSVETNNPHIGYRFDYSVYGMIYQAVQFRGMTLNSGATAVSNDGTQAAVTTYNYPGTPINSATGLSDVPTYTLRTDDWAGRTTSVNGNAPSYTFFADEATGISTVTAPNGAVSETHAIVHVDNWDNGLISDNYLDKQGSAALSHTVIDWEPGTSAPRMTQMRTTNDTNQTKAVVFSYTSYNNISAVSERDFTTDGSVSTTELRRTETTYVTSSPYTARHLIHLPATMMLFAGGSTTPAARVDYAYDNYGSNHVNLTARDDIIMHDPAFDPFQQTQETNCRWVCVDFVKGHCYDSEWTCDYYNPYDAATDYRGNVTSVTTYPDATSTANTITHASTYDIAGNVMTTQVDCCQLKSFTYSGSGTSGNHDYAYPLSVTSGGGGVTLTTHDDFDYNTGLLAFSTDENSQLTTNFYNSDSLRLDYTEYPAGAVTNFDYSDGLTADQNGSYHFYVKTSTKLDAPSSGARWVESYSYLDGREAVARTFNNYTALDGWATQDIQYDVMGRVYRTNNPYYSAGYGTGATNQDDGSWQTATYEHLGRVTQVTMPRGDNDNALTSTGAQYDGVYTTVTDQAAKSRRRKTDALGRLVRLDEPDTSGSLGSTSSPTLATSYEYDVLNNVVHVVQPGPDSVTQHRYLKYDSLSRLIRERAVEHDANSSYNLTDSVTGNSSWSSKLEYNSAGLVTDKYDPRGVHTQLSYDGLNRVTQITYSDSTPASHYFYDSQTLPSGAPAYDHGYSTGRLLAATYGSTTALTGTYFGHDATGAVVTQKQVIGSTTYSLNYGYNLAGLLTSETYPSGRTLIHSYDEGARLSQISDTATTFASGLRYAAHGGLKSESWGNGAVHAIDYNKRLQTSKVTLKQNSGAATPLQQYDYGYGAFNSTTGTVDTSKNNGQIGKTVGTIGSTTQWTQGSSYDSIGRLSNVAEYQGDMGTTTYQQGYTYNRWGNRLQSANATLGLPAVSSAEIEPSTNRLITSGSTPTTYDAAGNITTDTKFRNLKYEYDANGRQNAVKLINNTTVQTAVYDCAGLRVQTTASGVTRTMVYDLSERQVADYSGSLPERENIYRGGQLLAVIEIPLASPPTGLTAASPGSSVTLSWSAASGATNYRVERKGANSSYVLAGTTASTGLTDNGVSSGSAYLYRVCTADSLGNCMSSFSNLALGAAISFTTDPTIVGLADDPTGVNVTTVKAAHVNELRTAVNAVRSLAGLAAAVWTNTTVSSGMLISVNDVSDLRTELDEALRVLEIQTSSYEDPTLAGVPYGTLIKKTHITQLRQRVTSGVGSQTSGGGIGGTMYVLSDAQGSSRAVMNSTGAGTSTIVARHDYLPFGEEIGSGLRPGTPGYGATDNNRHKYALTERDNNTGLDHTWFRKYESLAGRWTSPDPLAGNIANPQSFNRYSYVNNDPVNFVDPSGLVWMCVTGDNGERFCFDNADANQSIQIYANYWADSLTQDARDWFSRSPFFIPNPEGPVGGAGNGGGPQNPQRPEKKPNTVVVAKKRPLTYEDCVQRQWEGFNYAVEQVKAAADKHFEERIPWLLDKIERILSLIPSGGEFDPGDGESLADLMNRQAGITEIEEGTQQAAKLRDQRIKANCKKP